MRTFRPTVLNFDEFSRFSVRLGSRFSLVYDTLIFIIIIIYFGFKFTTKKKPISLIKSNRSLKQNSVRYIRNSHFVYVLQLSNARSINVRLITFTEMV